MLGDSALLGTGGGGGGNSVDAVAAASVVAVAGSAHESGADTALSGDGGRGEEGDRSFGGNRWPRQETLALLKIRSDMDVVFRGSSVKGPLWEEVSRKLAELGYHRNSKKCKEKFENVYKYHKRTKEGRSGKSYGKTYRFFDQLQALEGNNHTAKTTNQSSPPSKPPQTTAPLQATPVSIVVTASSLPHQIPTTTTMPMFAASNTTNLNSVSVPFSHATNVPSTTLPISIPQPILKTTIATTPSINHPIPSFPPPQNPTHFNPSLTTNPTINPSHVNNSNPISFPNIPMDLLPNSSSSSTSSDETFQGRRKRKRKLNDFFERIMKEVIEKQEELQKRFLEAIEKREQEWSAREDAWRMQEMQRINSEREILAQERSMAAAKDAAVIALFQKIAEQQNLGQALNNINISSQQHAPPATTPAAVPAPTQFPMPAPAQTLEQPMELVVLAPQQHEHEQQQQVSNIEIVKANNGDNMMRASSPRWPKVEILALIKLRTSMDDKYQENGPKGALWEEISSLMKKHGYNRSAKRCKEKWENINKYYKKVKESHKKRPEDSKTCPYFHELDALYRERRNVQNSMNHDSMMPLLMVQPEQQWPPQQPPPSALPDLTMEDAQNDPMNNQQHNEEDNDDDDKNMDDDEGEEDDEGDKYEIVASKSDSVGASAE
ncbi:PREDICTED: trihelix transcription factor GT-2-like isoform X2 [Lupinus angustifolius]|uniref:trihelix transcription factor GT-2-like isoform X2 n=1 Tax=Lupinus angustifolius TaxID=3871 RepID=UPI00092EA28E|nr:PREDICTED: trihelix transcription factor GT-2-like isoform X2 [Lupinus angustifolius]